MVDAVLLAGREDSVSRRWHQAKPCLKCGAYVLWRYESKRRVPLDNEGREHACDPAHEKAAKMDKVLDKVKEIAEGKRPLGGPAIDGSPTEVPAHSPLLTYAQIQEQFKKGVHPKHVSFKQKGGTAIAFVTHGHIANYLDLYAPGWECEASLYHAGSRLYVTLSLTIHASDRSVTRVDCGSEADDKSGYGDPSSNAYAQALRRAAMRHGFCREWWTGNPPRQGRR